MKSGELMAGDLASWDFRNQQMLIIDMMDGSVLVGVTRYERSRASLS